MDEKKSEYCLDVVLHPWIKKQQKDAREDLGNQYGRGKITVGRPICMLSTKVARCFSAKSKLGWLFGYLWQWHLECVLQNHRKVI